MEVRFLTLNLCCLPSGLRNVDLPTRTFHGGLISFIFCWIFGTSFLTYLLGVFANGPAWSTIATITVIPCWYVAFQFTSVHIHAYVLGQAPLKPPVCITCVHSLMCARYDTFSSQSHMQPEPLDSLSNTLLNPHSPA